VTASVQTDGQAGSASARGWRRHRTPVLLTAAALVAVAVAAVSVGGPTTSAPHDPDSPAASGARATARVLADEGVDVTVVRGAAQLESVRVDDDTTVVVTSTELLGRSTSERLVRHVRSGTLVLVEPGPGTVRALGLHRAPVSARPDGPVEADCDDPVLDGLRLEVDRALAYRGPGCFAVDEGALVSRPPAGPTLLGAGDVLRNDQVLRGDNAAAALRLLGQDPRLVWYVPELEDLVGGDGVSLATLLPPWLRPASLLAVLAAVALVAWRARRLGPLAVEPLPVVVRALETTRSRGRLYRRAGDRGHAATALRRATRRRLAAQLAVSPEDHRQLVDHLSTRLGRPRQDLADLLGPDAPPPTTDRDLIELATRLAALEEEVRRP